MFASIQEIAELVGGQLRFGPMPPLDSIHQPIRRIVPSCRHARQGDVVLWCGGFDSRTDGGECFLEEAFMRGALGVIASRSVAAWPGCFSLKVDDPKRALSQIAGRQSDQAVGKRVLVVDPRVPSPVFHVLSQATSQAPGDVELAVASDAIDCMRWQLIGLDTARLHTLIHTIELPNSNWQQCFWPDVVVFTAEWRKFPPSDVLGASVVEFARLVGGATIVCPDTWCVESGRFRGGLNDEFVAVTYGQENDATIGGPMVSRGERMVLGGVDSRSVALASCWRDVADEALAAIASSRAIGLNEENFVRTWLEQRTTTEGENEQRRAS